MPGTRMQLHRLDGQADPVVFSVRGEIDLDGAADLEQTCADLAATGSTRLVVEMSQVTFMDSSGINALLRGQRMMTAGGGWLRLACVGPPAGHVIQLVGLDQVIDVHPDLDTALQDTLQGI